MPASWPAVYSFWSVRPESLLYIGTDLVRHVHDMSVLVQILFCYMVKHATVYSTLPAKTFCSDLTTDKYLVYSWHHKSAYTHLQFCGLEKFSAFPSDTWAPVIMPLGTAHQSLQPQLLRFLQTLARFEFPTKRSTSCKQKADAVSSRNSKSLGICDQTLAIFLHRQCNVLGEPLQVVCTQRLSKHKDCLSLALRTKVC